MSQPETLFQYDVAFRYWECSVLAKSEKDEAKRREIWSHWEGEELAGLPVEIQPGYYRVRRGPKGARIFVPVAILPDATWGTRVLMRGRWVDGPAAFWERHSMFIEPVTYSDYHYAEQNGRWPGDIGGSALSYNSNAQDPDADFRDGLLLLAMEVEEFIEKVVGEAVKDRETADKLGNWRQRLADGATKAEELRRAHTDPLNAQVKGINELWRPAVDEVTAIADRVKALLTPYLIELAAADLDTKVGGQEGRRVSLREEKYAEITCWKRAALALHQHPKVRETIQKVANANARSKEFGKEKMPGIIYKTRGKAV